MIFIKKIFLVSFVLIGCFIFGFSFNGVKATDEEETIYVESESLYTFDDSLPSEISENILINYSSYLLLDKDNQCLYMFVEYNKQINYQKCVILEDFDCSLVNSICVSGNYAYLSTSEYSSYPQFIDSSLGDKLYRICMDDFNLDEPITVTPELYCSYLQEQNYDGLDYYFSGFFFLGDLVCQSAIYSIFHNGIFMIKNEAGNVVYENSSGNLIKIVNVVDNKIIIKGSNGRYYSLIISSEGTDKNELKEIFTNDKEVNLIFPVGDNYFCIIYKKLYQVKNKELVSMNTYLTHPSNFDFYSSIENYYFDFSVNRLYLLGRFGVEKTNEEGNRYYDYHYEFLLSSFNFDAPDIQFVTGESYSIGSSNIEIEEKQYNDNTIFYSNFSSKTQFLDYNESLLNLNEYQEEGNNYFKIVGDYSSLTYEFGFDEVSHYVDYIVKNDNRIENRIRLYYSCPTFIQKSKDLQTVVDDDEYAIFSFNLNSLPSYDELIALMKDKFQLNECGIDDCEAYLYSIDFGDWDYPNYTNFEFENSQAKLKLSLNISDEFAVESKEFNYPLLFILTNDTQVTFGGSTKLKTTTTNKLTDAALLNMITITTTNGSVNDTKVNFNEYNLKYNVPGVYPVEVAVTDNWGASFSKQLDIEVYDGQAPTFSGYSDICKSTKSVLTVNDIMAMISVIDNCTDQDKLAIKVKEDNYTGKADQKGDYKIVFSCVDESNNESTFTVNIHVKEMVDCFVFDKKIINVRKGVTITKDDIKALITDFGFIDKNTDTYVTYTGDYFDSPNSIGVHEIKVNLLTSSGKEENVSFVVNVLEDINGDKIEKELNFFEKIWKAISDFFNSIFKNISNFFKNIGKKSEVKK